MLTTRILPAALLALLAASPMSSAPAAAQASDPATVATPAETMTPIHLSGPRAGMTFFTGDIADAREAQGMSPFMSQFGWQFEKRLVASDNGFQALLEYVPLVGGVEDQSMSFSNSFLAGVRTSSGVEFGIGPNVSFSEAGTTTSFVLAGGLTLPFGAIQVPINMAFAHADGGPRMTALVGWIVR